MQWNGTRAWICWPMHGCPILISVRSFHLLVSYTIIMRWRKFQNATRFLYRAAPLFLFFQPRINERKRTGLLMESSMVFQRNYSTKTILQSLQYPFEPFCFTIYFIVLISHPQLNWISDRKLEKSASSTWSLRAIDLYELFMRFSE